MKKNYFITKLNNGIAEIGFSIMDYTVRFKIVCIESPSGDKSCRFVIWIHGDDGSHDHHIQTDVVEKDKDPMAVNYVDPVFGRIWIHFQREFNEVILVTEK